MKQKIEMKRKKRSEIKQEKNILKQNEGEKASIYFYFEAKQKIPKQNKTKIKIRRRNKAKRKIRREKLSEKKNTETKPSERKVPKRKEKYGNETKRKEKLGKRKEAKKLMRNFRINREGRTPSLPRGSVRNISNLQTRCFDTGVIICSHNHLQT